MEPRQCRKELMGLDFVQSVSLNTAANFDWETKYEDVDEETVLLFVTCEEPAACGMKTYDDLHQEMMRFSRENPSLRIGDNSGEGDDAGIGGTNPVFHVLLVE